MTDDDYHRRLATEAKALWTQHLSDAEDTATDPEFAFDALVCAGAMAAAHRIAWGERGPITDQRIAEITTDFTVVFLKTLAELAPDRMSESALARMAVLDRDIKRRRSPPTGADEA
jgi:hypothetical protein